MRKATLHIAGGLTLCVWTWLAFVSRGGVSVAMLFGAVGMAWALLGVAWWASRDLWTYEVSLALLIWGVCFRVAGFLGEPLLEDDWARYLWDGRQLVVAGNPYATTPAEHFGDKTVPEPFQRVLSEINNPDVPTVYAPVCEYAFAISHLIAPGKLWPWKLIVLLADLVTLLMLWRLVPPRHALLYAWCPLLIQETAFTAHPESLWIDFVVVAMHDYQRYRYRRMAVCCGLARKHDSLAASRTDGIGAGAGPRGRGGGRSADRCGSGQGWRGCCCRSQCAARVSRPHCAR